MTQKRGPVLFVSHHSSKLQTAEHVERALNAKGVKCWIAPRDVDPGEPFDRSVRKAIADTDAMLLLFCSQSEKSRHVKRELILADQLGKAIIPLRLERIDPGELSYHLADSQWIDWLETRDGVIDRIAAKAREFQEQHPFQPSPPVVIPGAGAEAVAGGPDLGKSENVPPAPVGLGKAADVEAAFAPAAADGPVAPDHSEHADPVSGHEGSPPYGDDLPDDGGAAPKKSMKWVWFAVGGLVIVGLIALISFLIIRSQNGGITEEWFEGTWSDTRDCDEAYRFDRGGQVTAPNGAQGEWFIEDGDTLVVEVGGETERRVLERVSDDEVSSSDGSAYRCF
jgi:hypothetical protein